MSGIIATVSGISRRAAGRAKTKFATRRLGWHFLVNQSKRPARGSRLRVVFLSVYEGGGGGGSLRGAGSASFDGKFCKGSAVSREASRT